MSRLIYLEPDLARDYDPATRSHWRGADLATAQGIVFLCPKCHAANGGAVGTHAILVWFSDRGVPDSAEPGAAYAPGEHPRYPAGRPAQRWTVSGASFEDLTLKPSIDLSGGSHSCGWHGFVTNGEAV